MHEHTAYAAHAADSPAPDSVPGAAPEPYGSTQGHVGEDLYRSALGAVHVEHYLAAFARLDATGRVLPGWNWAAALCTLCWLAFWRLWTVALIYGLVLASGVALLGAAALGGSLLPAPMLGGLALALLLLLCVVPGMYGDALLHMALGRRVARAVQEAANLRQAADMLQAQAGSRSRVLAVALVGGLLLVLGAGAGWLLWRSATGAPAVAQAPAPRVDAATQAPPPAVPAPGQSGEPAAATPEPAPPVSETAPAVPAQPAAASADAAGATAAAAPDSGVSAPPHGTPEPAASDAPKPASGANPGVHPDANPAVPGVVPPPAAKPPAHAVHAPAPGKKKAQARSHASTAMAPADAAPAARRRLYVNVGTFADADNAARAQTQLRKAGVPVRVEQVHGSGGRRLQRVRAGPFTSTAQANAAVKKARALGLEAVPDLQEKTE